MTPEKVFRNLRQLQRGTAERMMLDYLEDEYREALQGCEDRAVALAVRVASWFDRLEPDDEENRAIIEAEARRQWQEPRDG